MPGTGRAPEPERETNNTGMTPETTWPMTKTAFIGNWVHVDTEIFHNWSVDTVTKRTISLVALILLVVGAYPLITAVHGQQPKTQLEFEVQDLQQKVSKLDNVPTEIALMIEHQKLEDQRFDQEQAFQNKIIYGFIGTAGSIFLALFIWALNQFGVEIGINHRKRRST